jgi:hypothetical protein
MAAVTSNLISETRAQIITAILKCCDRKGWNITWPPDSSELEVCKHLN